MATEKKSFVMYVDVLHTVKHLNDEQAGELFKHLLAYVNDEEPQTENPLIKIAFEPIKQSLKRDLKKWGIKQEQRVVAGRKGGLARAKNAKKIQAKQATATNSKQTQANQAVSVSVSGSVSDSVSSNDDDVYKNIDDLFKRYLSNDKLCKAVIDNNSIKDEQELSKRLKTFHKTLEERGDTSKTWKDYTSHFIHWHKKTKKLNINGSPTQKMNVI